MYKSLKKIELEEMPVDEEIIKYRVSHLKQIIFEATQVCNMSCTYCLYGGSYYFQRKKSSKRLSFSTAMKTINYLFGYIGKRYRNELTIGFFGGEPFSNHEAIVQIVNYSKKIFKGWKLHFSVTTNGTLLDERIISFLIQNSFRLSISLDGPQYVHDSKRTFPDGSGTFQIVVDNIKRLKEINEVYYNEQVSFFVTHSKDLPLDEVFNFFINNNLVKKNPVTLNYVNNMDTEYYDRNPYDKALTNSRINEIINVISTKKSKGLYLAPLEENLFIQITDMEKRIKRNSFSFHADSCLFDSRIYVDTDGNFHICEKMNDQFPFGDYQKGFDFPKMKRIALEFIELIKKNCRDCEARFLCIRCYIHFAKEGKFEISTEFCDMNKKSINKLEKLIQLKEKGVL